MSNINELSNCLISIFHVSSKNNKKFVPILKKISDVRNIPIFILNNEKSYDDKIILIKNLYSLYKENPSLINLFNKECKYCKETFMGSIIKLYLQNIDEQEDIFNFIKLCYENILIDKNTIDLIYQNLSKYFYNKGEIKLNEKYFLKHLNLLNLLLNSKKKIDYENKNYIYFNGINSGCFIKLDEIDSTTMNADNPLFQYGLFTCFWIKLNENIIDEYFNINKNIKINLLILDFEEESIKISFFKKNIMKISIFDKINSEIELKNNDFIYGEWNFIAINIKENDNLYLYINKKLIYCSKKIINDENYQIQKIKYFENLIGQVTSIFFLYHSIEEEFIQYLSNIKYGFYSDIITNEFFSNFLSQNDTFNPFFLKNDLKKNNDKEKNNILLWGCSLNILKKFTDLKNIFFLFTPFLYNEKENYLDDICCNFIGFYGDLDGVSTYQNIKINSLGGINNLLPLIELMIYPLYNSNKIIYKNIEKNILSEEVFYQFISIISFIICDNSYNLNDAIDSNFFNCLSIFIEKIPQELFSERIILKFTEISYFNYHDLVDLNFIKTKNNFYNLIFLNEKIISKFLKKEYILQYWKEVLNLNQLLENKNNIFQSNIYCLLLRYYDESRYNKFCCKYHSDLFENENSIDFKNTSSLRYCLEPFLNTLLLIIKNEKDWNNYLKILYLLTLDISPCLQILIIDLFINLFSQNNETDIQIKKKNFEFYLKNNIIEILLYVFTIGLLDVKNKIIDLLQIFQTDYQKEFDFYLKEKKLNKLFIQLIYINLLPENIFFKKEEKDIKKNEKKSNIIIKQLNLFFKNKNIGNNIENDFNNQNQGNNYKDFNYIKLSKYFNQSIYEQQKNEMFNKLFEWFNTSLTKNNNNNTNINVNLLDFIIKICSYSNEKNSFKFLQLLINFYEKEKIKEFCQNFKLFCWIVHSIYINELKSYSNDMLKVLIENFIFIFKIIISNNLDNSNYQQKMIKYINLYILFLRNIYSDQIEKIKEISRKLYKIILSFKNQQIQDNMMIPIVEFIFIHNSILKEKNNFDLAFSNNCIPNFIIKGLSLKKINNKILWDDSFFFQELINNQLNILNMSVLMNHLSIEFNKYNNKFFKIIIKESGFVQKKKNILYINFKNLFLSNAEKEELKINILEIIFIGLSIQIEISDIEYNKNYNLKLFKHLIIFCILISINISENNNEYKIIQDQLINLLSFGFIYLKKKDEELYYELINLYIHEIFQNVVRMEHSNPAYLKQYYYKVENISNCAIFKLFNYKIENELEIINDSIFNETREFKQLYLEKENGIKISIESIIDEKLDFEKLFSLSKYIKKFSNDKNLIFQKIVPFYPYEHEKLPFVKLNDDEKQIIEKIILQKVDFLKEEYDNYLNLSFFNEKINRNKYKKIKKELFSWRGSWSNKELFYDNPKFLKLKIKNHYSEELIRPILEPILDINYYFCDFQLFDKKKIFKKNNYEYNIHLDIDEILNDSIIYFENEEEGKEEYNNIKNVENNIIFVKNKYDFNYLEILYKSTFNNIWEYYLRNINFKINFQKLDINKIDIKKFQETKKIYSENNKKYEKSFIECCLVKPTHHIKGIMTLDSKKIIFTKDINKECEEYKNELTYDYEKNVCFGSTFKSRYKDKDLIYFIIEYENIKLLFRRSYFYLNTGIEILTKTNKSYFFNFNSIKKVQEFLDNLTIHFENVKELKDEDKNIIGYDNFDSKSKNLSYKLKNIEKKYEEYNISTLEYLMWLNLYGNRSFIDINQYPVFPWVITNYTNEEINITSDSDLRKLDIPMGMIEINDDSKKRKEEYIENYIIMKNEFLENNPNIDYYKLLEKGKTYFLKYKSKNMNNENKDLNEFNPMDINQTPYLYGSHYSNPTYVSLFLSRIFPYSEILIEIQGEKFDVPDRLFNSLESTFLNASSEKVDLRELIPEFFYLPEFLNNINNIDFLQEDKNINNTFFNENVKLPAWAKNKCYNVIIMMRKTLEKNDLKINKWVDLIFGCCQKGKKSEESFNIFQSYTYLNFINIENIKDSDSKNALMKIFEMGMTPRQLFNNESKNKLSIAKYKELNPYLNQSRGKKLIDGNQYNSKMFEISIYDSLYEKGKNEQKIYPKIIEIIEVDYKTLCFITNNDYIFYITLNITETNLLIKEEKQKLIKIKSVFSEYVLNYKISNSNCPIIINKNRDKIIKAGFYNGKIEINLLNDTSYIINNISPITSMAMTKNEVYLICGNKNGFIIFLKFDESKKIIIEKKILSHTDEIIHISICDKLDIFASTSLDGYVNLYTIQTKTLFRSIKLDKDKSVYGQFVFVSNFPIPSITIYIPKIFKFRSYTINGTFISDNDENEKIYSPKIFNILNFEDYLIYGTENGLIKIRKFPEMEIIKIINPNINKPILKIEISSNFKYCYVWCERNQIYVIYDETVHGNPISKNLTNLGFHV